MELRTPAPLCLHPLSQMPSPLSSPSFSPRSKAQGCAPRDGALIPFPLVGAMDGMRHISKGTCCPISRHPSLEYFGLTNSGGREPVDHANAQKWNEWRLEQQQQCEQSRSVLPASPERDTECIQRHHPFSESTAEHGSRVGSHASNE